MDFLYIPFHEREYSVPHELMAIEQDLKKLQMQKRNGMSSSRLAQIASIISFLELTRKRFSFPKYPFIPM